MDIQTLQHANYLDILFDDRNKQYGGYELRNNYHLRMKKAGACVLALCILFASYALTGSKENTGSVSSLAIRPAQLSRVIVEPTVIYIPPPQKAATAPPLAKPTVANAVPVIVQDIKVTIPPPTMDDLNGKESGLVTTAGNANGSGPATANKNGVAGGGSPIVVAKPSVPLEWVEKMPAFDGSISEYLQRKLNYPAAARDAGIEGSVIVQFVVNEEGNVTNAKVLRGIGGGCNEEALRVVSGMPLWKPGTQGGMAVKVLYTLPIRFSLQ